ncbi:MAG: citrate lyase holo-[acyl-carrier protein] synthase [Clostridiales bacterium]|nr:citrate lyase holo-[acyl-carrier protein] synthase [Clostridiales bacterium]
MNETIENTEIKCDERLCAVCGHNCGHSHHASEIEEKPVSVEDMAAAREERASRQKELIEEYGLPVVSFTMNVPGPVKYSKAIENCFNVGVEELKKALFGFNAKLVREEYRISHTGCEGMLVFKGPGARLIKAAAVKVEDRYAFSRLFDIDVIDKNGEKLSRAKPRKCLVCDKTASVCARSRAHSLDELKKATDALLREAAAYAAGMAAFDALIAEVTTTPKPGLVDRVNNGANKDMDIELFEKSAETLAPYFYSMAYTAADTEADPSGHADGCSQDEGVNCADCPSHESCTLEHGASLMTKLTILGVEAEAKMKQATGGVNTHKGAIFCMGLLVSAYAKLVAEGKSHEPLDVAEEAKRLAALRPDPGRGTNGAEAREKYAGDEDPAAVFGADAQARAGFPAAVNAYRRILGFKLMGFDENDCYALALLGIMAELFDTNAYKRAGREGAAFVRKRAAEIQAMPLSKRLPEAVVFDRELIERNINCGGAADMLAAAIFFDKIAPYSDRRGEYTHEEEHSH